VDILDNNDGTVIGGQGITVEIDESKFGKREIHKGKHVDGVWVFGGIETENKEQCFFTVVETRSAEELVPIIQKHIRPGTTIISNDSKAYSNLSELGYKHLTVNQLVELKNSETGDHTYNTESTWHCLKKAKLSSGYAKTLIASCFAEFVFRRKYLVKNKSDNPFFTFMEQGVAISHNKEKAIKELREKLKTGQKQKRPAEAVFSEAPTEKEKRPTPTDDSNSAEESR
jgi:hypothetical protein